MIKKAIKGFSLFFSNPALFPQYLRKFLLEYIILKFYKIKSNRKINIDGVIFDIPFVDFPNVGSCLAEQRFGVYEPEVADCLRHGLKPGDIFIDVGANTGYFSAIGASLVGKAGQVHSFEPASAIFNYLQRFAEQNKAYKIIVNQCAVGDKTGKAHMNYSNTLSGDNTFVPGFLEAHQMRNSGMIEVPMTRLDDYIEKNNLGRIALIKIDVEGYEFPVLKGLQNYFETTNYRPLIICEVTPSAYEMLGLKLDDLAVYMRRYGYEIYGAYNPRLAINLAKLEKGLNVIFNYGQT